VTPPPAVTGPKIGIFSSAELARVVAETVPADRTHAIVGSIDKDGAAIVVKMQLKEHWEVQAAYKRDWAGDATLGAKVVWSW
jgi:hypothetical protein